MSAPDTMMPLVSAPWLDADGTPEGPHQTVAVTGRRWTSSMTLSRGVTRVQVDYWAQSSILTAHTRHQTPVRYLRTVTRS
jgi:hypothetical protein